MGGPQCSAVDIQLCLHLIIIKVVTKAVLDPLYVECMYNYTHLYTGQSLDISVDKLLQTWLPETPGSVR